MSETIVMAGSRQVPVDVLAASQASVDADTVLGGSEFDARGWTSISYTIAVATNDVDWTVYGANAADYSDEVVVQAEATVAADAASSYAVAQAPYSYYRVKIHSHVGSAHGTVVLGGLAKS